MAKPALTGREADLIRHCLEVNQITMGPMVREFEETFAAQLGVRHAIAVSSGTAALHLALLAAGVKPGDRVLVPTLTYVATVAAVRYCDAVPVFVDADPQTWGMEDVGFGKAPIRAVLPVHLYGVRCDPSGPLGKVHPMQLPVVEDAAESLGVVAGKVPTHAAWLATYSFYGNKILTTGEGGMVVTDDDALAEEVRLLRGQGQDPDRRYWHIRLGYNYRMTDLAAAIGVGQLERLDEMLVARYRLHNRYLNNLADTEVTWQTCRPGTTASPWVFACLLPKSCLLYTSPSPRDTERSRMPSSA